MARVGVDPLYGGGGGGGGRYGNRARGDSGIEDMTVGQRGSSPAGGARRTSGANSSYASSVGGASSGSAGYALPTLAAASVLTLPPLKSSVVVVAPQMELPTPSSIKPMVHTPSGIMIAATDFSHTPTGHSSVAVANNRRAGSRTPSPAPTPRGSGTAATGMYSLATGAGKGAAGGAKAGAGASAADKADAAFEEEAGIMGTAQKLALPKRVEEGSEMVEYRARQAKEYNKKMRSLLSVNVMMTRSLGLMCKLRDGHATGVTALSYVDDGNLLASGAQDGLILVWNLELQKFERVLDNHQSAITHMSWHPDTKENQLVSASADSTVKLWDVDRGTPMITLRDHGRYSVTAALFSSDGDMLATAGMSKYVIVYNMVRMRANWVAAKKSTRDMMLCVVKPFEDGNEDGHKQGITKICWSHGNDRIVSASEDGSVRVWSVPQGGRFIRALLGHSGSVNDVSYDPLGERLLSAGSDSTIRIWNVEEGKCYRVLKDGGHKGPILQAVWTPEGGGRRIVSIGKNDRQIVMWEASTGLPMQVLENLHGASPLYCVAARPDALQVSTGGGDKVVGVWKANRPGICEYIGWTLYSCCGGFYKACCDCSELPEYVDDKEKGEGEEDEEGADGPKKGKKKKGDDDDDDDDEADAKDDAKAAAHEADMAEKRKEARKAEGLAALRAHKAARGSNSSAANAAALDGNSDDEEGSSSPLKGKKLKIKSKRTTRDYASAADAEIEEEGGDSHRTAEGVSARVKARDIVKDAAYAARANRGVKF